MATILAVHNSRGIKGRCDATCYDAKGPACSCICGGRHHGKGEEEAMRLAEETAEAVQGDIEQYLTSHGNGTAGAKLVVCK